MDLDQDVVAARPAAGDDALAFSTVTRSVTISRPARSPSGALGEARTAFARRWEAELRWPVLTYGATRVGLLVLVVACDLIFGPFVPKTSISHEFANWDGWWYVRVATLGYPTQVSHAQTTLGFFPLYPMVMWLVSHLLFSSYVVGGLVVSLTGGLVATVLVQRLVTEWWGPQVARKAVLLFCLFPGSVVFSMDYSEGLLIPLSAGCMLALQKRRWVLAGSLAGLATAIDPDALVLVAMCLAAACLQLRRYGWHDAEARRSMAAPLLSPFGILAFAAFLKVWAGSAMASFVAQRDGWHESTTILAVPQMLVTLVQEIASPSHLAAVNLNGVVGLLGTVFLVVALRWLWRDRFSLPIEVWVYVAAMTFLMLTSAHVPPNPRMLITTFPVVLVFAKWLHGRAFVRMAWLTGASLVGLSVLTYVGAVLRP